MLTSARSWIAALFLGLAFALAVPATAAHAHRVPACDRAATDVVDVKNPHCQPGHDEGDINGDGVVDVSDVRRADTGLGGTANGAQTTILFAGGGLLALGAAVGVRRLSRRNANV